MPNHKGFTADFCSLIDFLPPCCDIFPQLVFCFWPNKAAPPSRMMIQRLLLIFCLLWCGSHGWLERHDCTSSLHRSYCKIHESRREKDPWYFNLLRNNVKEEKKMLKLVWLWCGFHGSKACGLILRLIEQKWFQCSSFTALVGGVKWTSVFYFYFSLHPIFI